MRTETIRIDLNQVSHRSITLKQCDTTTLVLEVSALGQPYQLAGLTPVLVGLRNDGYLVIQTTKITVKGNELTIKLDPKFVAIVNELNIELELYNASEEKVSSYTIRTNVAESIGNIDAPVASEDVTDNIGQAITKAVEATNALKNQTDAASEIAENIETYLTDIEAARTQVAQNAVKAADSESKAQKSANDAYKSQQSAETTEGKITTMHNTVVTSAAQVASDKNAVETAKTQVDANASQISAAVEHLKLIDDKANMILGETAVAETLEITGTVDAPFRELHIYGASSQRTTEGINIFDMERWRQFLEAGDVSPATPTTWGDDGQYKYLRINGAGISTLKFMLGEFEPNTQYTLQRMCKQDGVPAAATTGIKIMYTDGTSSSGAVPYDTLTWTKFVTVSTAGKTIDRIELSYNTAGYLRVADVMLVKGVYTEETMPDEPYTGGKPSPSPDYPQEIVTDDGCSITLTDGDREQSVHINMSLCGVPDGNSDWTDRDDISVADGRVLWTRKYNSYIVTGAENWTSYSNLNEGVVTAYRTALPNSYTASQITAAGSNPLLLCSILPWGGYIGRLKKQSVGLSEGNHVYVRFDDEYSPTLAEWKAYLAEQNNNGTPVKILHRLPAPIITDITDTETGQALLALYSYNGTTTITTDAVPAVGLSAVYNCDTKSYIDKKFDELAELIHNLS